MSMVPAQTGIPGSKPGAPLFRRPAQPEHKE
jgi:hypothetical protein